MIVAAAAGSWESGDDEDVFYEARPDERGARASPPAAADR